MSTTTSPEELFEQYRHGNKAALGPLYDQFAKELYPLAVRVLDSEEEAKDVFQETWVHVVKGKDSWKSGTDFGSWIRTIQRNLCLDRLRKRGTDPDGHAASLDADDEVAEAEASLERSALEEWCSTWGNTALDPEFRQVADAEIRRMPYKYKVLILHSFDELSYKEMARREQISVKQVKGRLHRARAMLKERLVRRGYSPIEKASNPESTKVHHG